MIARAILLLLIICCFQVEAARADDAPILPGSHASIADAVAKSDLVFEGKLTNLGMLDDSLKGKYVGPLYNGAQIEVMSFYKAQVGGLLQLKVTISLNDAFHEVAPVAGQSYLFFVSGPRASGEYMVMKMLPATKENRRATLLPILKERAQKKLQQVQPMQNTAGQ